MITFKVMDRGLEYRIQGPRLISDGGYSVLN